jgi:4-hydroxyphenylpyruvate dioxygenase
MTHSRLVTANTRTFSAALPTILEAVKAAGFNGVELWNEDVASLTGGAAEACALLADAQLRVSAFQLLRDFEGGHGSLTARLEKAEHLMSVMEGVGSDMLLVCSNGDATSCGDPQVQVRDLRALAELAAARRMRIGFEPLAWSPWIHDYETAWACVNRVDHPALGITLDMFHLFARCTPLGFLEQIPIQKLFGVQLCNAVPMQLPAIEIARHYRRFPSKGVWPVAGVVQRLEARGYSGFYSVEVFNDDYRRDDAFDVAKLAWASFQELFE